jgi:glycosyltransferase involved in cell wall biosynthesis
MTQLIEEFDPGAVHIATEGPLGQAARAWCIRRGRPFSTAYHTRFPEYIRARTGMPLALTYAIMRRFHARSASIMVATASIQAELERRGFRNINRWSRGVDTALFRPRDRSFLDVPRPIHLYVGRVAVEKNVEAFLGLDLPGTKLVVGDGPQLPALKQRYPGVRFAGARFGEDLARHYAAADVFVFPSRTDTFGLVLLEALASGVPVAAYPVAGPRDVVGGSDAGVLDEDLGAAARRALTIPRERCRAYAMGFSWERSRDQFLANLRPFA